VTDFKGDLSDRPSLFENYRRDKFVLYFVTNLNPGV
jgi:hypothetical protein